MFNEVLFPHLDANNVRPTDLHLQKTIHRIPPPNLCVFDNPVVVFDFETTGLDHSYDRVIEVGAQKIIKGKVVDQMETLVSIDHKLSPVVQKITGINDDMLRGKPSMGIILPKFLDFVEGSILVAHNATFDMNFLKAESLREGISLTWPAFCTLKLARKVLPELESRTLDALAQHYGLSFESRHRSIGDVKVTVAVLNELLEEVDLQRWEDFLPYAVNK